MTEHDKSQEARKGMFDSLKGKAKEFAGAVTGNDSLTAEGQLEQTQAQNRKEANTVEAVADAEAEHARAEVIDTKHDLARERIAVTAESEARQHSVQADQEAQKRAVEHEQRHAAEARRAQIERDAERQRAQTKAEEQHDVHAAADDAAAAADEHEQAEHIASNARKEADRIRARAAQLTDDADLP